MGQRMCLYPNKFVPRRSSPHPKKLQAGMLWSRCRCHKCGGGRVVVVITSLLCPRCCDLVEIVVVALCCRGHRWRCHSHPGRVIVVAFAVVLALSLSRCAAAVGETLPAANAAPFPAEGAAGLASNSQAWLREPRLQSPRHCSPGQRLRWSTDPRCPWREGPTEGTRKHAWLPQRDPDEGMRQHHGHGERTRTDGAVHSITRRGERAQRA